MQTVALYLCYIQYVCNVRYVFELIRKISPTVAAYFPIMDWQQNKRNSDSEFNDFFLSTVPAQYFRPNDSENGDDSTKNCLANNVIMTSPGRCALMQRLMNNVYSFYRETSYLFFPSQNDSHFD